MMYNNNGTLPVSIPLNTGNGTFGGNGFDDIIALAIIAMIFGWNGNGGLFNGGVNSGAARDYVLSSDFANIERKIDGVNNGLCDGFYAQAQLVNGTNMNVANGFAQAELARTTGNMNIMQSINNLGMQLQQCCCDTRYENATNTRDIIDSQNNGTRAIIDKLCAMEANAKDEKIAELTAMNSGLRSRVEQAENNNLLINALRPSPIPAYYVQNPYGCNCGQTYPGYFYGTSLAPTIA